MDLQLVSDEWVAELSSSRKQEEGGELESDEAEDAVSLLDQGREEGSRRRGEDGARLHQAERKDRGRRGRCEWTRQRERIESGPGRQEGVTEADSK